MLRLGGDKNQNYNNKFIKYLTLTPASSIYKHEMQL